MRAYLLGTLPDSEAAKVETQYFTDPAFFLSVQKKENELIAEYVSHRMPASEKALFEGRYSLTPELWSKVEEAQQRHNSSRPWVQSVLGWNRFALASALSVCIVAFVWMRQDRPVSTREEVAQASPPRQSVATYRLSPGLQRSGPVSGNRLELPKRPGPVQLLLELPGITTPVVCDVQISAVGDTGQASPIWKSTEPALSRTANGGQEIQVTLDSSLLPPAEYILRVKAIHQGLQETYVFRASRAEAPSQ